MDTCPTPADGQLCYLSLGSNMGDRRANLRMAIERLGAVHGLAITRVSRTYRTAPVGVTDQPEFLNLVLEARATLAPGALLQASQTVERELGRTRGERWGPRIIDIDLLLYDDVAIATPELTLPHPRMWERAFVLVPLAEIASGIAAPDGRAVAELAATLAQEQTINADLHV